MKIGEFEHALANDPATSFWLKEQFEATKKRDPVDALRDAETLVFALKARVNLLVEEQSCSQDEEVAIRLELAALHSSKRNLKATQKSSMKEKIKSLVNYIVCQPNRFKTRNLEPRQFRTLNLWLNEGNYVSI